MAWWRALDLESEDLGANPGCATFHLSDLGQVIESERFELDPPKAPSTSKSEFMQWEVRRP